MDKRYQVFVSSTYADLKEERQHVIQALMEMDCIPAGMELFPAADQEQWEFIKKVIDDCDYYLLVIGGRYGSTTDDGISYTEKEFDYAIEKGLKVIALVHGEITDIPFGKSESDPALREKLSAFQVKVMNGRLVKFWKHASELPGLVALSLTKTIKMYPAVGWVRANLVASEGILLDINQLRKENAELKQSLTVFESQQYSNIEGIADIDSKFMIDGSFYVYGKSFPFSIEISWREIFAIISPYLMEYPTDTRVNGILTQNIFEQSGRSGNNPSINDQLFKTITIQLKAYGLIETRYSQATSGNMATFWNLTKKGEQLMMESRVVR